VAHDRIPSVRELAVSLEVNPNTVMHSYTYLQDNGIIYNRRGIGYHVAEGGDGEAKRIKRENFVTEELPRIFRTMRVLDFDPEDIERLYEEYTHSAEERNENE
jgi:DNA-binding transcriptional regulator YhcF (GntR family)